MAENKKTKIEDIVPQWDLSGEYYTGTDDPRIKADKVAIEDAIEYLRDERPLIKTYKAHDVLGLIRSYEAVVLLLRKLSKFASLNAVTQLDNSEAVKFEAEISDFVSKQFVELTFIHHELVALPDAMKMELLCSEKLRNYRHWLEAKLLYWPAFDEMSSKMLMRKEIVCTAWSNQYEQICANMTFTMGKKTYSYDEIRELAYYNDDREMRKKAQKVMSDKFEQNAYLFVNMLNNIYANEIADAVNFRCDSPMFLDVLANGLTEDDILRVSEDVCDSNIPVAHRFYKLMHKMHGFEKMCYVDRVINPVKSEKRGKYTWVDCLTEVLETLLSGFPNLAALVQEINNSGRIDAKPAKGKRSGAFCTQGSTPFVLMNFHGKEGDAEALIHELGHGAHHKLCSQVGVLNDCTSIGMAEVASEFNEELLFNKRFAKATTDKEKLRILIDNVSGQICSIHRQIAFSKFEQRVCRERKKGVLSKEMLDKIYTEEMQRHLGFELEDEAKNGWMLVPHFFNSPFYVRYYAFAGLIVNRLMGVYKKGKVDNFEMLYIDMLSNTGVEYYDELLEPFDLNPDDDDFWTAGIDVISARIDEIEKLAKKEGLL